MPETTPPADGDSFRTQFWVKRWERATHPWDLGKVPPDLLRFLSETRVKPTRVLIPGCGTGYEVRAFHEAGHDVLAVDFSGPAVAQAKAALGPLGDKIVQMNFFKHDFGDERFGLVYERGFLCSIPRERWPEYAAKMTRLVQPGGAIVGLFLYGNEPEPPPFPLDDSLAQSLLGPGFELTRSEIASPETVPVYQGMERWQEWVRRSS